MSLKDEPNQKTISAFGFFNYFKSLLGYHLYILLVFNVLVGLLDGLGLALFIPLLSIASGGASGEGALGDLTALQDLFLYFDIKIDLASVLIVMVILFSVKGIFYYLRDLYFVKLRLKSITKIRYRLIAELNSLSYIGYTKIEPGQIQFAMVSETTRLIQAMTYFIRSSQSSIILITYIVLAYITNWQFAILVTIGGALSNLIYKVINSSTRKQAKIISQHGNNFNSFLIQAIQNFKYLKATNSFAKYQQNLKNSIFNFESTQYKIGKLNAISNSLREPITILIIASVILIQVKIIGGTFGGILVSLLLFYRALSFLIATQNNWNNFLASSASLDALNLLSDNLNQYKEVKQNKHLFDRINKVKLTKVHLELSNKEILHDINLTIHQGETIAIIGESGAGKSTLANLIGGLYQPTSGDFTINNNLLSPKDIESYRDRVGYISQEPVIFDDTLFNNVTFWDKHNPENMKRFNECIKMVHLKDFVDHSPLQENTKLGNDGVLISGGQKQRISIARELYREVDILVMDEATSALDVETENIIKHNIDSLHGKYIIIIIAHRLSTIKNADRIYMISNGKIIDSGNYHTLFNTNESFRCLVDSQSF